MKHVNDKFGNLDARVSHVEKVFERMTHLNELKLIGIPATENENLIESFIKFENIIGYDTSNSSNIPAITRMISRDKVTQQPMLSSTVLMKFAAVHMKDAFYSLYLRLLPKKKVSSTDLGFSVDKRLIVGENLSALNHEIFIAASNMKREQKLAQVFTINGLVNVKL